MNNNLKKIEKELRSFAKRCKEIKYTHAALFAFLFTGFKAFTAYTNVESIESARKEIKTSITDMKKLFRDAKKENNKLMKNSSLELVQLMEQGDHVVKSPWSSWQTGTNYYYSNWTGKYKGSGDKKLRYPYEGLFTRSENPFERYTSPLSEKYKELTSSLNLYSASSNARAGLNDFYGIANTTEILEPPVTIEINATVKPKSIEKAPIALNIPGIMAPALPPVSINQATPPSLNLPEPVAPNKTVSVVQPNADPFTGFFFNSNISALSTGNSNITLYSGVNPDDLIANKTGDDVTPALKTGVLTTSNEINQRPTNILYRVGPNLSNMTFHVRGFFGDGSDGYTDAGSGHNGGSDPSGGSTLGTIGVHTLLNGTITNVTANLYGRAGFLTSETWRHGKVRMVNTNVNVYGKENTVYYIMPAAFNTIANYTDTNYYLGALQGTTNVKMYGTGNTVYLSSGISAARLVENDGKIELEGASNIVYSSFSYAPTWEKTNYGGKANKMNSVIRFSQDVELYGDENVVMFFGSKIGGTGTPKSWQLGDKNAEIAAGYLTKASYIGIYQGELDIKAVIGKQLAIDGNAATQTAKGKLVEDLSNPSNPKYKGYTDKTVDGGVGLYVVSGQREGINAIKDLGIPVSTNANFSSFQNDPIHNLEVGKLDIKFGKYSKNGFMMISKLGSVIDIGKATNKYYVTTMSSDISDGINGDSTSEADASTGTTIAYAEGTWDQSKHQLGSTNADVTQNNTDAASVNGGAARKPLTDTTASTAAKLQGLPSEINIYPNVVLASKEGIAYMGDNKGIVNAKAKTEAVNYGAIIGYARNGGKVEIDGEVKAIDKNTSSDDNKYKNIVAFSESGGTVTVKGKATVNGIGAFAKGANSKSSFTSNNNDVTINAGTVGGLVATEGGYASLNGGTINITKDNSRLFYADATGKIDFTKTTTINMSKGIILPQEENDATRYSSKATGEAGAVPTRYNGMRWVTIKLLSDDVILKTVNNHTLETWNGSASFESGIQGIMKYHLLDKNGHTYKVYYTNGEFKIASNVNLDSSSDVFNSIIMANEKVTIDNGVSITSATGKGLVQGSLKNTVDNSKTGYINNGTVNISGGNSGSIGIRVSHGTIENNSLVKINDGIGLYGTSGSKIINKPGGTVEITAPSAYGVGISGFLSGTAAQEYGTDKLISNLIASSGGNLPSSVKTIDITNEGKISIAGKAIGIYADNTSTIANFDNHVTKENAVINNKASLDFGDDSIGIFAKKSTINLTGTGSGDISTGKNGLGIYAKDSSVNLLTNYGFQLKDNGTGIYLENTETSAGTMEVKYTGATAARGTGIYFSGTSPMTNRLNVNFKNISGSQGGIIGVYASGADFSNEGNIKIENTNTLGFGIIASGSNVVNKADITLEDSLNPNTPNIGMYTSGADVLKNIGNVKVGKNGIGIYGKDFENGDSISYPSSTIEAGENGIGIYSTGGTGNLKSGSIKAGKDGVGVYIAGNGGTVRADASFSMNLGDGSEGNNKGAFGFVNVGQNNKIISNISNVALQNNSVYIYSKDTSGTAVNPQIENNTDIIASGKNNYGIYSAGYAVNTGNMNLQSGTGNVGVYSIKGGTIENRRRLDGTGGVITVGGSIPGEDEYGVGMAAGYSWTQKDLEKPLAQRPEETTGNIINRGTINVNGNHSIGMYGSGLGTTVENHGTISLNTANTTGIYLNDRAVGHNYGLITNTTGVKNVTAVVVKNGARLVNEPSGRIILDADNALGVLETRDNESGSLGIFENYGTFEIKGSGSEERKRPTGPKDLNKSAGKGKNRLSIDVPAGSSTGTIKLGDEIKVPEVIDTQKITLEETQLSSIGMYINTSGTKFTKPITGLSALSYLKKADLIIGTEATESTNSKYIQIGSNILKPYNDSILNNPQIEKWNIYAGSLTWMANIAQNQTNGTIENAYLAKIPYTNWAGNEDLPIDQKNMYNFLDGLEQRYGIETLGSKENQLFQKLNKIGNNEKILLYQAFDEMMGHQYANVQQRIYGTGRLIDKEITHLSKEWDTESRQSNKIKTFGMRDEYKTDTAGIIDYASKAYGFAYVHENETVKLGNSSGWYAGAVHNRFKFKDIGGSKENQTMLKLGAFKTMSPAKDHNGSLQWTISGEGYVSRNDMHRKYLVVDEIFNAKSDYTTYGVAVKNELGYNIRTSERTSIRPYGGLKLEYGRFSNIKEKSGEMRLDIKGNDYYSIKPEVGVEFKYRQPMAVKTTFVTSLGVGYENELGQVGNVKNKAKVSYTEADWFNIRGEKDDRKGNFKADLNIGVENQRFGVTLNGGYDTKGKNARGGIGFRIIY